MNRIVTTQQEKMKTNTEKAFVQSSQCEELYCIFMWYSLLFVNSSDRTNAASIPRQNRVRSACGAGKQHRIQHSNRVSRFYSQNIRITYFSHKSKHKTNITPRIVSLGCLWANVLKRHNLCFTHARLKVKLKRLGDRVSLLRLCTIVLKLLKTISLELISQIGLRWIAC